MKHKTAELVGALLDAAVAKAEGHKFRLGVDGSAPTCWLEKEAEGRYVAERYPPTTAFDPSTDWAHGGTIIERESINVVQLRRGEWWAEPADESFQSMEGVTVCAGGKGEGGPTPLIAAMRAYVASRFGDTVDLP